MENDETEWIESPHGWEDDEDEHDTAIDSLFNDTDPRDSFQFRVVTQGDPSVSRTIEVSGFKLDSNETAKSTGVTLWQGSTPLSKYIMTNSTEYITGLKVLELGAGLGLVGIVAHHLGARKMILTDGDTNTLQKMRQNVKKNCREDSKENIIDCRQLLWGNEYCKSLKDAHGTFDTVLAADVIYTPESIEPLFDTVATLMQKPHGRFLLSWFTRVNGVTIDTVLDAAKTRHFDWTETKEGIYVFVHGKPSESVNNKTG